MGVNCSREMSHNLGRGKERHITYTWLSMIHVKTLCERLLSLFMLVAATFLLAAPYYKHRPMKFASKSDYLKKLTFLSNQISSSNNIF